MKTSPKKPLRKGPSQTTQARILVVDDHPLMRLAVREIIRDEQDLVVCGEASNAATAMQLLKKTQPHLVLLDLSLGEDFGLDVIKQMVNSDPSWRILVLSIYDEALYAERVLRAGARGYLNKRESPETILAAIRSVLADKIYLPSNVVDHMLRRMGGIKDMQSKRGVTEQLSDRELQTFELLGMGVGSRDIARRLGLSLKTVEVYRERIKSKLGIANASELTRRAVEWVLARS